MIKGQPSRTALMTAVQRGHHYMTAPEPKILQDDLALALSGLENLDEAQGYINQMLDAFTALSDRTTAETFMKRIDGSVCMRSRVVEEELARVKKNGIQQLVVLGAGLDSTAYRRTDLTEGLQVFEVDHPSTQAWKRERLEAAKIGIPDNLTFVSFDFEHQTLEQALKAGGVRFDVPTFFTWLGVHMYLTDEAVKSTLGVLGKFPKVSEIVMDFISPSYVLDGEIAENSVEQLAKVVSQMGEPLKSEYYEHELEALLNMVGFNEVKFLNAGWLVENYLGGNKAAFDMPDAATSILYAVV